MTERSALLSASQSQSGPENLEIAQAARRLPGPPESTASPSRSTRTGNGSR